MIILFSRYKADFLRFPPENPANYVSILMYELERKAPSECRKSHFRGPRFQNSLDPPTSARFSASVNKTTGSAPVGHMLSLPRFQMREFPTQKSHPLLPHFPSIINHCFKHSKVYIMFCGPT